MQLEDGLLQRGQIGRGLTQEIAHVNELRVRHAGRVGAEAADGARPRCEKGTLFCGTRHA